MSNSTKPESWHTDKRIPVALLLGMAVQFFGFIGTGIWYIAKKDFTDSEQDKRLDKVELIQDGTEAQLKNLNERFARFDERQIYLIEVVKDLKRSRKND